ncbi:MAG TPA: nucleotide disphospho-sugar-binding domain-containing protein [Opitutaceae bacterium]|nr:nucleotide disphospho-sugar-binding domain-containing protein [Opitutaceae bacterium]
MTTWEGGGTVAPMITVARRLAARGHSVRMVSDEANRREIEAAGLPFKPWRRAPNRPDRTPASESFRDWDVEGVEAFQRALDAVWTGPALAYAQDLGASLQDGPADLVVTSELLLGVAAGCEAARQPFVMLSANVSIFSIAGIPPMGRGLRPAGSPEERREQDRLRQALSDGMDHGLPALNAARRALGLPRLNRVLEQTAAARALLLGTARAFDFAPDLLPEGVHYVGPQLDEPGWTEPWSPPFPADDLRPMILVAFSTTFQAHAVAVQRVLDAAEPLPVRVLVTLGGSLDPSVLRAPANARLVPSAPHNAAMEASALVVTHGGHGTVVRALAHRRPLLILPHGRDQNDNASRVIERGAGLTVPRTASTLEVRAALETLLSGAPFHEAAQRLGAAIAREAENSPVASVLEAYASPTPPTRRVLLP